MCNNENIKITVLLPLKNGERYVEESVKSILSQTYENFELIIVNDGSTDSSGAIVQALSKEDNRIKCLKTDSVGVAGALNAAIDLGVGEFFARMDADDIAHPERFKMQLKTMLQDNVDILGTWARKFQEDSGVIKRPVSNDDCHDLLLSGAPFVHPSVMIRGDVLRALRYNANYRIGQDYELWTRAAMAGFKFGNLPNELLYYRVHGKQISKTKTRERVELLRTIQLGYWKWVLPPDEGLVEATNFLFGDGPLNKNARYFLKKTLDCSGIYRTAILNSLIIRALTKKNSAMNSLKEFHYFNKFQNVKGYFSILKRQIIP